MFCTNCGKPLIEGHRFCGHCGTPVAADGASAAPEPETSIDWRASMIPGDIMAHPEVRARIEKVTGANPQGMTAEQFYDIAKPVMMVTGAGPLPPMKLLKDVALPLYAKLGVKTQSEASQGFRNTFGETLAAVLCSLAGRGQPVEDVAEAANGCVITSKMASSMWSWEGKMVITLETLPEGTMLKGTITVPGQTSDWGKTKRALQALIDDVRTYRQL